MYPTSDEINALPEPLRRYIHDLETRCDPAGELQERAYLQQRVTEMEAALDSAIGVADLYVQSGINPPEVVEWWEQHATAWTAARHGVPDPNNETAWGRVVDHGYREAERQGIDLTALGERAEARVLAKIAAEGQA